MRDVKFMKSGQICEIRVTEVKVVKLIKCMKLKYATDNKQNITGNDMIFVVTKDMLACFYCSKIMDLAKCLHAVLKCSPYLILNQNNPFSGKGQFF